MTPSQQQTTTINTAQAHDFQHLLETIFKLHQDIEQHMIHKKAHIITGNAEALTQIDVNLIQMSRQLQHLEQARSLLLDSMGLNNYTLRQICSLMPKDVIGNIRHLSLQMERIVNRVHELNQEHQQLLELSMSWIEQTVKVLAEATQPKEATYGNIAKNARISKPVQPNTASLAQQQAIGNAMPPQSPATPPGRTPLPSIPAAHSGMTAPNTTPKALPDKGLTRQNPPNSKTTQAHNSIQKDA